MVALQEVQSSSCTNHGTTCTENLCPTSQRSVTEKQSGKEEEEQSETWEGGDSWGSVELLCDSRMLLEVLEDKEILDGFEYYTCTEMSHGAYK